MARAGSTDSTRPRRRRRLLERPRIERVPSAVVLGMAAAVVGLAGRAWIRQGAAPLQWNDSADYLAASHTALVGLDRLAGPRPVLMPLVLSAAGSDPARFVVVQAVLASAAWGLLVAAATTVVPGLGRRVGVAALLLGLSLTWPIAMWDQQVLTESTAITALVLVAAAGTWFVHHPSSRRAAALIAAAGIWLAARDSHLVPIAIVGLVALVAAGTGRTAAPRRLLVVVGAYLVAMSFLAAGASQHGHRDQDPIQHVYMVRVLPYPDRIAWFRRHGMPDAAALESVPEITEPKGSGAEVTPIGTDPIWGRWRAWIRSHGRGALVAYELAHPGYAFTEPLREPERVFNNNGGVAGYRPLDLADVPGLARVLYPPTGAVLVVAAGAATILAARRRAGPLAVVGVLLVTTALPHALAVWHGDGMESGRHLLLPGVQLRLGVVLLVAAAATGGAATGTGRSRPARSHGRRRAPLRPCG